MSDGRMLMGGGQPLQQLPGGMTHEELEKRQAMEYEIVMAQHLQHMIVVSADLVKTCSDNEVFEKMPGRERTGTQAMLLHADFCRMQVLLMETIRKKMNECQPFASKKGLNLTDINKKDAPDVLVDPGEKNNASKREG